MKYNFNNAPYGTHNLIAKEIGKNKTILDVGCNKGYLKQLAVDNDFYGIDFDEDYLKEAKNAGYNKTFKIDLNNYNEFVYDAMFDVIVFGDVLEHLMDPAAVLNFFSKRYLKDGGKIIISLPNVANIVVRLNLLLGNFDYTDSGILDKTHLHLYTKKTGALLVEECGLKILDKKYSSNNFGWIIKRFPCLGGLLGFNLIFVCQKGY